MRERNAETLFDQVDLDAVFLDQFFKCEAIGAVAVKTVGFLDQHDAARGIGS
jgi:hypothetical protein